MKTICELWSSLLDENQRGRLTLVLGVIIAIVGGGWTVFTSNDRGDSGVNMEDQPKSPAYANSPKEVPDFTPARLDGADQSALMPAEADPQVLVVSCRERTYVTLTPQEIKRDVAGVNAAKSEERYIHEYQDTKWIRVSGPARISTGADVIYTFGPDGPEQMYLQVILQKAEKEKVLHHVDGNSIITEGRLSQRAGSWQYNVADGRVIDGNLEPLDRC